MNFVLNLMEANNYVKVEMPWRAISSLGDFAINEEGLTADVMLHQPSLDWCLYLMVSADWCASSAGYGAVMAICEFVQSGKLAAPIRSDGDRIRTGPSTMQKSRIISDKMIRFVKPI